MKYNYIKNYNNKESIDRRMVLIAWSFYENMQFESMDVYISAIYCSCQPVTSDLDSGLHCLYVVFGVGLYHFKIQNSIKVEVKSVM
jgi:hypothetical protein